MKFIYSEKCLEYNSPGHPESPDRVRRIYEYFKNTTSPSGTTFEFLEPVPCEDSDILLVHTQSLLNQVKSGNFLDPDTPALPNIYEYARLSAGGALKAMQITLEGDTGFSIMRPPGHHAGKDKLGGFCYFNNIAIAAAKANRKAAILDIDCHHGNGTQDIFLGRNDILYLSLHRFGFFYPGTGGESTQNVLNYPLSYGIDEEEYLATLDKALQEIVDFKPSLLGVSAGFDTYNLDPIAGLGLEVNSYRKIGERIKNLSIPTFYILEGGYSPALPQCVSEFILGIV